MAMYKLTAEEVQAWDGEGLGYACLAPDLDIDTYYNGDMPVYISGSGCVYFNDDGSWRTENSYFDMRPSIQGKTVDLIVEDELWTCPYCYALNYVKVGHCHHCAGPRR